MGKKPIATPALEYSVKWLSYKGYMMMLLLSV